MPDVDAGVLDIAIAKKKNPGKEIRYDVANLDFTGEHPTITSRLGRKFALISAKVTPEGNASAVWNALANDDPERIVEAVGAEALVAWARGLPFELDGTPFYSLQQWIDAQVHAPEGEPTAAPVVQVEALGDARTVVRVSGALERALGFRPTLAIPLGKEE